MENIFTVTTFMSSLIVYLEYPQFIAIFSVIPGTQSIYVKTWGCSHNNSDGEYMAGQLAAFGYKITGMKYSIFSCL